MKVSFVAHRGENVCQRAGGLYLRRKDISLLDEIEAAALSESQSLATALRKCIALAGRAESGALREWATQELRGYEPDDDVPAYRVIHVLLAIDGSVMMPGGLMQKRGEQISVTDLQISHVRVSPSEWK